MFQHSSESRGRTTCYDPFGMQQRSRQIRKLAGEELFGYALRLLAGRALSAGEVRTKLRRKAEPDADIEALITRLRELGFLNDERFAESYATARRDSGSVGAARVMRDLRSRRVAPSVAEKAVQETFAEVNEADAVTAWLERKYRSVKLSEFLQDEKNLASAYRKLRYAGFSSSASIRALKQFASRADQLEDPPEE